MSARFFADGRKIIVRVPGFCSGKLGPRVKMLFIFKLRRVGTSINTPRGPEIEGSRINIVPLFGFEMDSSRVNVFVRISSFNLIMGIFDLCSGSCGADDITIRKRSNYEEQWNFLKVLDDMILILYHTYHMHIISYGVLTTTSTFEQWPIATLPAELVLLLRLL